jgi:hypothetical protein
MLYMDLNVGCHQADECNGNALDLFLKGAQFEIRDKTMTVLTSF